MATKQLAPLVRQARLAGSELWSTYGNVGLIEAAELHANSIDTQVASIEVRDVDEPDSVLTFRMTRRCKYVCENPRLGMVDE